MKMRLLFTAFILPLFINACQSTNSETKAASTEAASSQPAETAVGSNQSEAVQSGFEMKPDTITVRGKFASDCDMPKIIKIAEHNELSSPWKETQVNANGEFNYKMYLAEPRRIALRTEKRANYDFIATTKKKVYDVDIACFNKVEKLELKDSEENAAYHPFGLANRKFRNELDTYAEQDISNAETFGKLKAVIQEYQKEIAGIAAAHPKTFTASVLCAAEVLPEGSLASADALRKNFLKREAFADPHLYNDFLAQRIIYNYLAIRDKNADSNELIETLMNTGAKNPEAAKRLQQITYNIFYNKKEEGLLMSYIKWAEANPDAMHNPSVKGSLARLGKVMPGNEILDIQLNDPSGVARKLSETAASSKLTLLVFYSPTCNHCQEDIPKLKPVWDQFKAKGLKIYIVGFDSTNDEWDWFIKNKAYSEWTHVFDQSQRVSYQYVVNYTPTYVLIDSKGKIISRMADLAHVQSEIPNLFK